MDTMDGTTIIRENSAELKLEIVIDSLTDHLTKKLLTMPADSYSVSVYRISEKYRKINEEAYTPRLVSIGPLHHGKSQLQAMESYKLRCLQSYSIRAGTSIGNLVKFAAKEEISARGCYEDTVQFSSKEFCEMILLDGAFIIELLFKNQFREMRTPSDVIFENKWMSYDVLHDMLLVENQLPINFLEELFKLVERSFVRNTSLLQLASAYFSDVGNTSRLELTAKCLRARHFVEFLVYLHEPTGDEKQRGVLRRGKFEYTRSASELQEAGVKFKLATSNCLFEVSFSEAEGVVTIPQLKVNDFSETFFRNLIAFEQCGHYSKNITSYIIFMDSLINTSKDVELLEKNKIIENYLGESQQVADLFNNLYKDVVPDQKDFYFATICSDLNNYSKNYIHEWKSAWFKWKVILRRDYFSNPWAVISLIAAIILLILTIIQTVCTLIQTK